MQELSAHNARFLQKQSPEFSANIRSGLTTLVPLGIDNASESLTGKSTVHGLGVTAEGHRE